MKLFCKHEYEKIDYYEKVEHGIRYSVRIYKCKKCGKEIHVDGRAENHSAKWLDGCIIASCEYCDVQKYDNVGYTKKRRLLLADYWYVNLYMTYDPDNKTFAIVAEGEGRAEIHIKYCPMCGRKVK